MNETPTAILDRSAAQEDIKRNLRESPEEVSTPEARMSPRPSGPAKSTGSEDGKRQNRHIKRILVPTDFSAASGNAVERAVAIANQCNATMTILHVVDINAQVEPHRCGGA